ncbi:group II truncated hemoglobin [Oceanicoccus sp. KOV_DT_Chl]|uniref:group II truncated hemoglobin n=1 Tax=Oceanicoccus sp. KOV_DT_Chl TaxID=1904639 RepID=UPI000C7C466A|nr:group II truncated hemoglobin [Oceanicoccus sp. KOV_DT_Chl]
MIEKNKAAASATARPYGDGDTSFQTAGGEEGVRQLVDAFYDAMNSLERARTIRAMHPDDLTISRDKLARFLCGWLGGPKLFSEKYGPIQIPKAHNHLVIGVEERDAWLQCMAHALKAQPYPQSFKDYLLHELFRPADRSRTKK